jgi:hypothetical protein
MSWVILLVFDIAPSITTHKVSDLLFLLLFRWVYFLAVHLGVRLESVFCGSGSCGQDFYVELWSGVIADLLSWFVLRVVSL